MGLNERIAENAMSGLAKEATEIADHLERTQEHAQLCPDPICGDRTVWISRGVRVSLRILLCVLAEAQSPRKTIAAHAAITGIMLVVLKLIDGWMAAHGAAAIDPAVLDLARQLIATAHNPTSTTPGTP